MKKPDSSHQFIYIDESAISSGEGMEAQRKLDDLKRRVRSALPVREYRSLDDLSEQVTKDLVGPFFVCFQDCMFQRFH